MIDGYRLFQEPSGSVVVTAYRYRSILTYVNGLTPGNPEFDRVLALYEKTAKDSPSTRGYLNPKILAMRGQADIYSKEQGRLASLSVLDIGGKSYLSPRFKKIEEGKLVLSHENGSEKIDIDLISDAELKSLIKIDPGAQIIKVFNVSGKRLWNPEYKGISEGAIRIKHEKGDLMLDLDTVQDRTIEEIFRINPRVKENKIVTLAEHKLWNPHYEGFIKGAVSIKHEKGVVRLNIETIDEKDKKTIMGWSDGTWKIAKPGLYDFKEADNSYGELVVEDGHFYSRVSLKNRSGESITIGTDKGSIRLSIRSLANLTGLSSSDLVKMESWCSEIIEERIKRSDPVASTEVVAFDKTEGINVTKIRARILQVLDEGVLASEFVGRLHKGTQTVRTTMTVTVEHPITGEKIHKVTKTSTDSEEVVEDVSDDLCYIVGNTSHLVDGEIVKIDRMTLLGRYQYVSVVGAPRSVRKYHVD